MKQDEKQFDTEKEHQKYLDDLARLRKIREEEKKRHQMKESFDKDTFVVPDSFSDDFVLPKTEQKEKEEISSCPSLYFSHFFGGYSWLWCILSL